MSKPPCVNCYLDTDGLKKLWMTEWQLNHLLDLGKLLATTSYVIVSNLIECFLLFLSTHHTHLAMTTIHTETFIIQILKSVKQKLTNNTAA